MDKKQKMLVALCCMVYFASYITRTGYAATINVIASDLGKSLTVVSLAATAATISYGAGQFLSGALGDRIAPHKLILAGLFVTMCCNLTMAFLSNTVAMTVVWCLNGMSQAFMWPPLTRIMAGNLSPDGYRRACVNVSSAASVANIVLYLAASQIVKASWRLVFGLAVAVALSAMAVWYFCYDRVAKPVLPTRQERKSAPAGEVFRLMCMSGALPILLIITLQGIMRDGVTTWMPAYIQNVYHEEESKAILKTAILPLLSIVSLNAAGWIHKKAGDEYRGSIVIWTIALVGIVPLMLFYKSQAMLSVVLMAVVTGCMHGVNLMYICMYPSRFSKTPYMSTISGILNAFTYVGASISTYGFAAVSEHFGWGTTVICWGGVIALGLLLSVYVTLKYRKKMIGKE